MRSVLTVPQLEAAADDVAITFADLPVPFTVNSASELTSAEAHEISARYERHGFAILDLPPDPLTPDTLLRLAGSLCLGEAFVPPLYTLGGAAARVSCISATLNASTADADHPSFGSTAGQELHCDGTLQDIGFIKASMLLCAMPAAEGGDTTLFNSAAAFAELVRTDIRAARALATPGTLVRTANINGCTDSNRGPAFTLDEEQVISRYSVTATDSWAVPDGVSAHDLMRGVDFLRDASRPGNPLFTQLRLDRGQTIIFNNTRIAHGRTPYRNAAEGHRCMYRSLHLHHPRALALSAGAPVKAAAA